MYLQNDRLVAYFFSAIFSLILIIQTSCNIKQSESINIKLYIYKGNTSQNELNGELFIKQQPILIFDEKSLEKTQLIQRKQNDFAISLQFSKYVNNELERITSANIGQKLVFISGNNILFAPLIFDSIKQGEMVIELPIMSKEKAENIARHFSESFEVVEQFLNVKKLDPDFRKAYELRDKGKYDEAVKIFEHILQQNKEPNIKILLYNEMALCYRLKKNKSKAAEIYRKLIRERVEPNLDNYKVISQAYFYLSTFEKNQQNISLSEDYLNQGISTLEFVVSNFPTSISADWASLTIGTYELLRGNITEAQKRAIMAKQGNFKGQGYLLLGLCYEYQKEFEKASNEYKRLIKNMPASAESKTAREFIENLDNNKTNIKEFLNTACLL